MTNLKSAVPRLDDLTAIMKLHLADISCITESWCHSGMSNEMLKIDGYHLIRRDRENRKGGGLLAYIQDNLSCKVWTELHSDQLETVWFTTRSACMPRQFSHISLGLIYHPPDADHTTMIEHINRSIDTIRLQFPQTGFIITGDLNQLPTHCFKSNGGLVQLVKSPTRLSAMLDKIYTNMAEIYSDTKKCPPSGMFSPQDSNQSTIIK